MDTLLIQLAAPMQSWGVQSLYGDRDTGLEPSKSGVIGLICAALGLERTADLSRYSALRMGVRIDKEGILRHDFQKAARFDDKPKEVTIGLRHYLADAAFLVGLEGDLQLLTEIQTALQKPVFCQFLGRKAFPPAGPVWLKDGLRCGEDLWAALSAYPAIAARAPTRRRVVIEDTQGEMILNDQPVSFAARRFAPRRVHLDYFNFQEVEPCSSHN
jgi:CRISPR system Cascade subunit CasD